MHDIQTITKNMGRSISNNSPAILSAMGVFGVVSTAIMVAKATPKAMNIVAQEEFYRDEEVHDPKHGVPLDILDKIELTWKTYLPSVLSGALTITCIISANHISARRNAALISLLGVAERTLTEYQEKVRETIGERKDDAIRAEIAQDTLDKNPMTSKNTFLTGHGTYPCYDKFSGRYFESDIEFVRQQANEFNRVLNLRGELSINAFYELIGLESIDLGDEFIWSSDKGLLEFKFDTRQHPKSGAPVLVIDYRVSPRHI